MDDESITASPSGTRQTDRDFSSFLYARLVENLGILLPAGGALYLLLAGAHLYLLPAGTAGLMSGIALFTALVCGWATRRFRSLTASSPRGRSLAFGVAVLVLANPLVHLQQTTAPRDTTMIAFVVLSLGLVYVDRLQIYTILAAGQLAWTAIALKAGWSAEWTHFAFTLMVAQLLSIVTFESRRRMYRTLFGQEGLLLEKALTDPLTGLANRAALMTNLAAHFARTQEDPRHRFALCFVDLNGFKRINDVYGHSVGDEILQNVGKLLMANCRAVDLPARLGGDEFVVVYDAVNTFETAAALTDRTRSALVKEMDLEGVRLTAQASIGVVWSGHGYANEDQMLEAADGAMYREKRLQGNSRANHVETEKAEVSGRDSVQCEPARV